jgi:KaiC/GvpD/RAD55 family RecA-like ATPase
MGKNSVRDPRNLSERLLTFISALKSWTLRELEKIRIIIKDHLQQIWSDPKDSRGLGSKVSSEKLKNDIAEIERMLKVLIKSLESKHLNP